ncbi:MAG: AraC family transcriptional regulator [Candidatus Thiodiazotropha sp. (ex Dulcina madagascariensis)]|nr:AraC family transcriptional regulator [Candidatus Thiodiazotropha sp. (ex Dulcina madagascariensis)]MCU7927672.1 AraC family transcriptional regulator [Candidatus Thiodiazotropha sp. (ex Dulcina madagascariensis)]
MTQLQTDSGINTLKTLIHNALVVLCCLFFSLSAAEPPADKGKGLDRQVEDLKQAVIELNRELFILEEELLFPGNTQVSVFISMDIGKYFKLDSVQLQIDQKELANHLYTEREIKALQRGGVQRLYLGNLKAGEHELVAFFTGVGPKGRDYKRGATVSFSKGIGPKYLELKIVDGVTMQQPDFEIREWE